MRIGCRRLSRGGRPRDHLLYSSSFSEAFRSWLSGCGGEFKTEGGGTQVTEPNCTGSAQAKWIVYGQPKEDSMFERFTDRSRRVCVLAQEAAREFNHNYIGTEHLLYALIAEGHGVAALALDRLCVTSAMVGHEIEKAVGRGERPSMGHLPFTPRAKKILELSLREALQLGHNYIGTEHILLGIIREGEGLGAQILVRAGAELVATRQTVIQILAGQPAEPSGNRFWATAEANPKASGEFVEPILPGSFVGTVNQAKRVESQTLDPATLERFARNRRSHVLKITLSYVEGLRSRGDVKWPTADEVVATAKTFEAYLSGGAS